MTMTDNNSTSNNGVCDFEERSLMPVPIVITKFGLGGNENDDDDDSDTVSSLSSDENEPAESSSTSSPASDCLCESSNGEEAPRLLFPKYWTKTGEESPQSSKKRLVVVTSSPPERSSSPQCVMRVNDRNPIADPSCDDDTASFNQEQQSDQNRPRSLFSQYWKKTGEVAPSLSSSSTSSRPVSPQCVRNPLPDPFAVFGLLEDYSEHDDDDEFSTNTYERMISHYDVTPRKTKRNSKTRRPYESKPLFWSSWFTTTSTPNFTASAPSLSRRAGGLLASMTSPGFGSAPVLQTKPLPSVLRKGRFSGSSKMGGATFSNHAATPNRRSVHFQPQVQVQSYQPPVESWAADGWSSWFGV